MKVNHKENAMKMQKNNKKSGFTLVELMVVAIIVAILAAVAIPLMSGNRNRAIATEAQAGCSTVATGIKLLYVQSGNSATNVTDVLDLPGINEGDLDGTYFDDGSYEFTLGADSRNFSITANGKGDAAGGTVVMTVTDGSAAWSGSLLDE